MNPRKSTDSSTSRSRLGIWLTPHHLRLLWWQDEQVAGTAWKPLNPNWMRGGEVLDPSYLGQALGEVLREVGYRGRGEVTWFLPPELMSLRVSEAPAPAGFSVALDGSLLAEVVARMPGEIQLEQEGEQLRLLGGTFQTRLQTGWIDPPAPASAVEVGPELSAFGKAAGSAVRRPGSGALHLRSENAYGFAEETVPAAVQGEPLCLTLNGRFLREALPDGGATLRFSGAVTPLLITGQEGYQALLIPMRT